jgi:hypothetical protein
MAGRAALNNEKTTKHSGNHWALWLSGQSVSCSIFAFQYSLAQVYSQVGLPLWTAVWGCSIHPKTMGETQPYRWHDPWCGWLDWAT